jgi:hypothetical protein
MLPKRKLEVELYKSIETRIQEAIDVLEERGKEKPNLAAAAREFELPPLYKDYEPDGTVDNQRVTDQERIKSFREIRNSQCHGYDMLKKGPDRGTSENR